MVLGLFKQQIRKNLSILALTIIDPRHRIQHCKQEVINAANKQENKHRIPHEYHVGDKILICKQINKLGKLQCPTQGPFVIVKVQDLIDKGSYKEKINIRCILPFFPQSS